MYAMLSLSARELLWYSCLFAASPVRAIRSPNQPRPLLVHNAIAATIRTVLISPFCSDSSKSSEIPLALAMGRKGGANGVGRAFGVSCFVRTHETPGFSRGEKSYERTRNEFRVKVA